MRVPKFSTERRIALGSPLVAGLLVAAAGLLVVSATRISIRAWKIHREQNALEARIRDLEAERRRLEQAIAAAASPETVERLAKERLNLKQLGEEVVVVTPAEKPLSSSDRSRLAGLIPSWLRELFGLFAR